jgi:quercetin dioxygenase-like cupin family protein
MVGHMKSLNAVLVGIGAFGLAGVGLTQSSIAQESSQARVVGADVVPESKLETLLSAQLEGVDGTEVIVSRVTIPPNTALPKHWHPGEEFAYVLEGSVVLWRDGEAETTGEEGDVLKVSLKQVHTAVTRAQGATILVFRVHEQGKPERVLVE